MEVIASEVCKYHDNVGGDISDDPFGGMFDILTAGKLCDLDESIESTLFIDQTKEVEEQIKSLEIPNIKIDPQPLMIEVAEFDPKNNVLDKTVRDKFKHEIVFDETDIFTQPISTTNTMEGNFSNVQFHERDLIDLLIPDEDLVVYRCNYGKTIYEGYTEPVKQKTTNRGRKPKAKPTKTRKKQGNGGDFNSQVTFVVRSNDGPEPVNGIVLSDAKVFKVKVFRTGKLQLPGIKNESIDDVITCANTIAEALNFQLHPGETDPTKVTNIVNLNPVMKNYKFIVKLPPRHIINMKRLKDILRTEHMNQRRRPVILADLAEVQEAFKDGVARAEDVADVQKAYDCMCDGAPEHPDIFLLKPNHTKLSIKFSTPIFKKEKKKTRINIFMRGKINILGAFDVEATRQICNYLHWIFKTYFKEVVVLEGGLDEDNEDCGNIEPMTNSNANAVLIFFRDYTSPLPPLLENDYAEIINMIDTDYIELVAYADSYLTDLGFVM